MAPFRATLGALWASLGLSRRSLGTLRDAIWSFGSELPLCKYTFQSVGFRPLGHSQGATILLLGRPWRPLGLLLGSLRGSQGSLRLPLALSGCTFCAICMFSWDLFFIVLFALVGGGGRCAIRQCLCMFRKGSPSQKRPTFDRPWATWAPTREAKRARERPERSPE